MLEENKPKAIIDNQHPFVQFFILFSLCLIGGAIFTMAASALTAPLFHVTDIDKIPDALKTNADLQKINALKFVQFWSSIGLFLLPAFFFAKIKTDNRDFFYLRKKINPVLVVLAIIIVPLSSPLVGILMEWNSHLQLPAAMQSLQKSIDEAELKSDQMISLFLHMNTFGSFLITFFLMAILPAVCEELIFRGCLMNIFNRWFKNYHVAIWVSGAIFSFIHFQFYGFVPRMMLGALFGYLFYWSGTLWVPIIAHAATNGIQVILSYLFQQKIISYDLNSEAEISAVAIILSAIFFSIALFLFYRKSNEKNLFLMRNNI